MSGRRGPRSAADRIAGLIKMLPWLMQRETVAVADMARQFDMSEHDLVADIEMAAMCGMPPYTPFELTEMYIDEGIIHVGLNKHLERRLRLTASEAFGLALLARAALEFPDFPQSKALKSALAKLSREIGDDVVTIDVEDVPHLDLVAEAARTGERLRIRYWTPGSNSESERVVTVRRVFSDRGHWYLAADDDKSGELRFFRVDRIRAAEGTGEIVDVVAPTAELPEWFADGETGTEVVVELAPEASWVTETYPCRSVEELGDGRVRAVLTAGTEHWIARLLLRAGSSATVISPPEWADLGARTAAAVLARYGDPSSGS
ncbi:MAG: putative proteasome accessory factor [Actinomycetota bacterium]